MKQPYKSPVSSNFVVASRKWLAYTLNFILMRIVIQTVTINRAITNFSPTTIIVITYIAGTTGNKFPALSLVFRITQFLLFSQEVLMEIEKYPSV